MHASRQLYVPRRKCSQMPRGTLKKKHPDLTEKTHAAMYSGVFVVFFFPSGEAKYTPMVSIFSLWISPPLVLSLRLSTSPSLSRNACQLVAASTQGSRALIRYCKFAYRRQAIHVPFLWFPFVQGGAQTRKDGWFPTINNCRHVRAHTCSATHLWTLPCRLHLLIPHPMSESQSKHYWPLKRFLNSRKQLT